SVCVLPGCCEVRAIFLRPIILLIKDDLPTLERPLSPTSLKPVSGYCSGFTALINNSISLGFIFITDPLFYYSHFIIILHNFTYLYVFLYDLYSILKEKG